MEQGTKFENNYLSKVSKIQIFDFLIKAYVSEILQVKKPPKPLPHPGFKHLLYDKRFCLGWVIVAGTSLATKAFLNLIIKIIDLISKKKISNIKHFELFDSSFNLLHWSSKKYEKVKPCN